MRFAYIDSQGNEVSIPSVDALALRIELGAIGPETELYDAQADRWGPADSHEIYHALARDLAGASFLVPAPPEPEEAEPEPPAESPVTAAPGPPPAPTIEDLGLTLMPAPEQDAVDGPDMESPDWGDAPPPTRPSSFDAGELEDRGFDVLDLERTSSAADAGDHGLDLTPLEGEGFPLPQEPADGPGDFGSATFDFGMLPAGPGSAAPGAFDAHGGDAAPFSDGFELEQPLEFGSQGLSGSGSPDGLDLEPPMSDFDPSAPPAWMEQDGPRREPLGSADDEPALDFGPGGGDDAGLAPGAERREAWAGGVPAPAGLPGAAPRAAPPSRSAPSRGAPRRTPKRRSGGVGPLVGLLGLVALGAGGWYGWSVWGGGEEAPEVRPPVVIPAIPAELEDPMRTLADQAIGQMLSSVESAAFAGGTPTAPNDDWLAGIYLGNASRYEDVEQFWQGVGAFADRLRNDDARAFHDAYVALAGASDFDAETAALMTERADSGFMATREARLESYALLRALADAALTLHDYLVLHEPDIAYTPARGFGGNPVEEAVPATDAIGRGMWDRVGAITTALDRLGTLDRVTRERLSTVVRQRIQEIGIR